MKRLVSFLLAAVLLAVLLPVPQAKAAVASWEYREKVEAFINDPRWAQGTYWGRDKRPTPGISEWGSLGCCAYCADFVGYVYGSLYAWNTKEFTKYSSAGEIGAGDIVHFQYSNPKRTSEHWIVVLDRVGDALYTAEGNAYVDGQYSRVLITDEKWVVQDGQLVNTWNKQERCFDLECYRYSFSDGGVPSMDPSVCLHKNVETVGQKQADCEAEGYTGDRVCKSCSHVMEKGTAIPALTHAWSGDVCLHCGRKASGVYRLGGENRFDTAINVAEQMKVALGVKKFSHIVIASGTGFADALAGSYLAATLKAPILLSYIGGSINEKVAAYVRENLEEDGLVYILGGESAVPESLSESLTGCNVRRLYGDNRFETNLAILAEAGMGSGPILVCTAGDFADSLSAASAGLPILLVGKELTEAQKAFLENAGQEGFCVIGGEAAVSRDLEIQLTAYGKTQRLAGTSRFDTSALIAQKFFPNATSAVLAYAKNYPDGLCGGALAAAMGAPLVLAMDGYTDAACGYVGKAGMSQGFVLGSRALISDPAVKAVFALADGLAIREK